MNERIASISMIKRSMVQDSCGKNLCTGDQLKQIDLKTKRLNSFGQKKRINL